MSRASLLRRAPLVCLPLLLASCGLSDTASSGAAAGDAAAEQARQAKSPQARVKRELEEAAQTDQQQREAAEHAATD